MKRFTFFLLAGVLSVLAVSCNKSDIENLQKQIDELKGGKIATLESQVSAINTTIGQLQSTQDKLQGYISELQKDGQTYKTQIAELQAVTATIDKKITDLKAYTETEISKTRTWAEGTFATLDQMDSLCKVVAKIPSKIAEVEAQLDQTKKQLTADYTKAIKEAVEALETSMKKWVNEKLADYYTIAQIDATLDSISRSHDKADSTLAAQIAEQKVALDTAKSQITRAYKAAIKTACDALKGEIDEKIATDIATAKGELQTQIDTIKNDITNIKNRLDAVEADIQGLIDKIQSIVVIPSYIDGTVKIAYGKGDTLRFDMKPERIADSIAVAWKAANATTRAKMVSIKLQGVSTKAGETDATVDSVFFQDGEFKVITTLSNPDTSAVASLHISYGKSDVASEYFGLCFRPNVGMSPATVTSNMIVFNYKPQYNGWYYCFDVIDDADTKTDQQIIDVIKQKIQKRADDNHISFSTAFLTYFAAKKDTSLTLYNLVAETKHTAVAFYMTENGTVQTPVYRKDCKTVKLVLPTETSGTFKYATSPFTSMGTVSGLPVSINATKDTLTIKNFGSNAVDLKCKIDDSGNITVLQTACMNHKTYGIVYANEIDTWYQAFYESSWGKRSYYNSSDKTIYLYIVYHIASGGYFGVGEGKDTFCFDNSK